MPQPDKIGNDFKLLAIRPRQGCHQDFLKVLKTGQIYKFYQDYEFQLMDDNDSTSEVKKINYHKTSPDNLFDLPNIQVNISAIVGQNGSGKSTLSELIFYAIYYWGIYFNQVKTYSELLKIDREELNEKSHHSQDEIDDLSQLERLIYEEESRHQFILENFKASLFYQFEGKIFEVRLGYDYRKAKKTIKGTNFETIVISRLLSKSVLTQREKDISDYFFYTLALNYSQFGLNNKVIGNWILTLFHKNDAYQLPISINPMRTNGNFDINKELSLAKYRLLHNLLIQHKYAKEKNPQILISENQFVKNIHFYFNENKIQEVKPLRPTKRETYTKSVRNKVVIDTISSLSEGFTTEVQLHKTEVPFKQEIFDYIFQKVVKISRTYPNHKRKLDFGESTDSLENKRFFEGLKKDNSHVTFKLKQAVNFLYHSVINKRKRRKSRWIETELKNGKYACFSLQELSEWIDMANLSITDIINHIPPSLFRIEIMLSSNDESGDASFESLSSGEQQFIHSLQSVLYHLNNINSVFETLDNRKRYKAVNILYDEIELYFHPEYQRLFIKRLLNSIKTLTIKNIKYLNIQLSTHSPFILSDIPRSNVLCLEKGNALHENQIGQSFAANIHDLLANEFFMKESFMGEYAKTLIESCIIYLNYQKNKKAIAELELSNQGRHKSKSILKSALKARGYELQTLADQKGYPKNFFDRERHKWYKGLIDTIGEPIVKTKLQDMYFEAFEQNPKELARQKLLQLAKEFDFNIDPNTL